MKKNTDPIQFLGSAVASSLGRNSPIINGLRPAYESVLHGIYGTRGIPWKINGQSVRISPRHRHLMGQQWDPQVAQFLKKVVKPGSCCLNVGANVGLYVLQLCKWSGPAGTVFAFEPNSATREALGAHIRMNGLEDRVEVLPDAISDREGTANFFAFELSGMSRLNQANEQLGEAAQRTVVSTTTIDAFCSRRSLNPSVIVMDIEGHEFQALVGARQLLASSADLHVVVEMHPTLWADVNTTPRDFSELFAATGFRAVSLMGQKDPLAEIGSIYLEKTQQSRASS